MTTATMTAAGAIPTERGCGTRKKGGIYLEVGLSPDGLPLEDFIIDPPVRLSSEIRKRGVSELERDGRVHVLDWVGEQYYPNVADFIEEVRRFGLSRRAQTQFAFDRLGPDSRIVLAHPRAWIDNWQEYRPESAGDAWPEDPMADGWSPPERAGGAHNAYRYHCPRSDERHERGEEICAGLWWEDVTEADPIGEGRAVQRRMPSFSYGASRAPEGVEPEYAPGIFMVLPISRIAVVNDPEGGRHERAMSRATLASLPVDLVEE